jgi:hypothetical protein
VKNFFDTKQAQDANRQLIVKVTKDIEGGPLVLLQQKNLQLDIVW